MYCLENNLLKIEVAPEGAELRSLFDKQTGREYIWQRDARYWAKSSPILFPFVGELQNGAYSYAGKTYSMTKHGFARDAVFRLHEQGDNFLTFALEDEGLYLAIYPFSFTLLLRYELTDRQLSCTYEIYNPLDKAMYFAIGGHPAFQLDFTEGKQMTDYQLFFPKDQYLKRFYLDSGLLQPNEEVVALQNTCLPLSPSMFNQDAWVLKGLQSTTVTLQSNTKDYQLDFSFEGFPYFGLWAVPGSSFICLEPWCGVNDSAMQELELPDKEGIVALAPLTTWSRTWSVTIK